MHVAQSEGCTIEAIRTQPGSFSQFEGLAAIEQAIRDIPNQRKIKRTVVTAHNDVKALLTRTDEDDLIVVGFSARAELESWMFGDMARALLEQAEGPVIMVTHSEDGGETSAARAGRRILSWFRPTLTRTEQDEIVRQSARNARLNIDYIALILVSATIATFGLLLNSSAVIIGAMLVAPLISPLIALSTGVTVGRVRVAGRALVVLGVGVLLSLLVAWLAGSLLPSLPTDEMLSRGRPTVLDAIVALASGTIGAYATARKDIPAALAGVAIAAALMPPLCVVGLGFALGETALATGALLLFLTNIICIIFSGVLVFIYLGMTLRRYDDVTLRAQLVAVALLIIVAIPVAVELFELTQQVSVEREVRNAVVNQLPEDAQLTNLSFDRSSTSDLERITLTIRTAQDYTASDFQAIEADIAARFDQPIELAIVTMPVLRIPVNSENPPQ